MKRGIKPRAAPDFAWEGQGDERRTAQGPRLQVQGGAACHPEAEEHEPGHPRGPRQAIQPQGVQVRAAPGQAAGRAAGLRHGTRPGGGGEGGRRRQHCAGEGGAVHDPGSGEGAPGLRPRQALCVAGRDHPLRRPRVRLVRGGRDAGVEPHPVRPDSELLGAGLGGLHDRGGGGRPGPGQLHAEEAQHHGPPLPGRGQRRAEQRGRRLHGVDLLRPAGARGAGHPQHQRAAGQAALPGDVPLAGPLLCGGHGRPRHRAAALFHAEQRGHRPLEAEPPLPPLQLHLRPHRHDHPPAGGRQPGPGGLRRAQLAVGSRLRQPLRDLERLLLRLRHAQRRAGPGLRAAGHRGPGADAGVRVGDHHAGAHGAQPGGPAGRDPGLPPDGRRLGPGEAGAHLRAGRGGDRPQGGAPGLHPLRRLTAGGAPLRRRAQLRPREHGVPHPPGQAASGPRPAAAGRPARAGLRGAGIQDGLRLG
eukprot:764201-Hanusia_phi.AAC.1